MISEVLGLLLYIVFGLALGLFSVNLGVSNIKERKSCTEERQAKFLRIKKERSRKTYFRRAMFEVNVCGTIREESAVEDLSTRQIKRFVEGQKYTIYVNPKNPRIFRCVNRVVYLLDIFCILNGSFITLSVILYGVKLMVDLIGKYI